MTNTSTEVTVRDREQFLTTPSDALDPTITWGSLMPPFPARSYYVEVTFTPEGYSGGTEQTVVSNTVSTASNASGTYTFTEGTW